MARPERHLSHNSTRAVAGALSALLHVGLLLLVLLSGGERDGVHDDDTPLTRVVLFESEVPVKREGTEPDAWQPSLPRMAIAEEPELDLREPPSPAPPTPRLALTELPALSETLPETLPVDAPAPDAALLASVVEPLAVVLMPPAEASALLERIESLAEEFANTPNARVSWQGEGRTYDAALVHEPSRDGTEADRLVADVSADDQGRQLKTRVVLKRLPFSHYAQIIDRWDPMVQMHDDEIVGRMHINSRFNALFDTEASPQVLGKVSTAAGRINLESRGRGSESKAFRAGIETNAGRIVLPIQSRSFERSQLRANARVHELADDTRIRFLGDEGYSWREKRTVEARFEPVPDGAPVYFIAAPGATVYVQGVVSGRYMVYSPQKIVIEGSLNYARDPRTSPRSGDFLGLVCDRNIEVARPQVTGPGDLHIQAAMFAKRRFVITDIDHLRTATLHIYGSLAAGTLTASEPRYATKLVHDGRFERLRPPGFPSTNRFAAEAWDGRWTEVPERAAAEVHKATP